MANFTDNYLDTGCWLDSKCSDWPIVSPSNKCPWSWQYYSHSVVMVVMVVMVGMVGQTYQISIWWPINICWYNHNREIVRDKIKSSEPNQHLLFLFPAGFLITAWGRDFLACPGSLILIQSIATVQDRAEQSYYWKIATPHNTTTPHSLNYI